MLGFKRILCGFFALILIFVGISFVELSEPLWFSIGVCLLIVGVTLGYIAVMQNMPNYSFWITLVALGLAYFLIDLSSKDISVSRIVSEKSTTDNIDIEDTGVKKKKIIAKKKVIKRKENEGKSNFKLSSYPKISGSANIIHAHIFYIGGRYVRLFGVDAPDNDQICSDAKGSAYNCGEQAVSWLRGWIDTNPIDCYILKVSPNGYDLATCVWGDYDIGAALVGAGWALANKKESDIYVPYEVKAQSESSGLWQGTFYSPKDWRDIKNSKNDFTIRKKATSKDGFFDWF